MKKHIILFIAIFFASVLHAQTISIKGTVIRTMKHYQAYL